jgi:hypothetical protein
MVVTIPYVAVLCRIRSIAVFFLAGKKHRQQEQENIPLDTQHEKAFPINDEKQINSSQKLLLTKV